MANSYNLINKANTISKNPNILRGIIRTISQAGTEVIKEYVPVGDAIVQSNKKNIETFRKMKVKPPSMSDIKGGMIYKTSKQFIDNALEDLKSGKFDNKERTKKAEQNMLNNFFGFADGEMDKLLDNFNDGQDVNYSKTDKSKESKANIEVRNTKTNNIIMKNSNIKPILGSLSSLTKNVISANSKGFAVIDSKLSTIVDFNNNVKVEFYNNLAQEMNSINDTMNKLSHSMEQLSNLEVGGLETANNFNQLNTILDSTELLTLRYYTDKLGKSANKKETKEILSPIVGGLKTAMMNMMPMILKDALKESNELIKAMPTMLNQKFKDMKDSDNTIKSVLGEMFYKDSKATRKYEKGPVAFDGITRRSIVNVIPSLLGKILNSIKKGKPGDELIYDYEAGGFRTAGDIKKASYKQNQMHTTRELNDEDSAAHKFLSSIVSQEGVTRKEKKMAEKAIRKMVMNKEIPRKGKKFSNNSKVNQLIMESWLNMSPANKADFVRIINFAKTPEEFLLENESFHNVDNIFGFDDLFGDKKDPDLKKAVKEYLYGKGYRRLGDMLDDGDAFRRSENNLSRLNPLYYVVEGIRKGNDLMSYIMFGGDDDRYIGPNSLFGRVRRRSSQLYNDIIRKPMDEIKRRMRNDERNRELNDELSDMGFGDTVSDFFRTIFDVTKGSLKEGATTIKGTIHEKFIDPIMGILKEHVVDPLKRGFATVSSYISKFFQAITGPFRRAFQTRRDKMNRQRERDLDRDGVQYDRPEPEERIQTDNSSEIENRMRENERNSTSNIVENRQSVTKMGKLEKLIITKNTEVLVAIRQNITKPIEKLSNTLINTANIGSVYNQDGFELLRIADSKRIIKNIDTNLGILAGNSKGAKKEKEVRKVMDKYGVSKEEALELIENAKNYKKEAKKRKRQERRLRREQRKLSPEEEARKGLDALHRRYEKRHERLQKKYENRMNKAKIRLGNIVDTFKDTFSSVFGNILKSAESVARIVANTAKGIFDGAKEFVTKSVPKIFKSSYRAVKDTVKTTIEEVKDFGKATWGEFKNQAGKILGLAGSIFNGSLSRLTDFFNRIRQKRINIYITGGYIDGIREPIKIIKKKKSGYDYMKDKFKEEDAEDAQDTSEEKEKANSIRSKIAEKIKERLSFIGKFLKNTVGAAFKGITSAVGRGLATAGGRLAGKLSSTIIGKAFKGVGGLFKKLGNKLSERKSKGSKVLGKILGKGGDLTGVMEDATPVYVVGGTLDVNIIGGGGSDLVDDIIDKVTDKDKDDDDDGSIVEDAVEDVIEEVTEGNAKKGGSKLFKKFTKSKLGKKLANSKIGKKLIGSKWGGKLISKLSGGAADAAEAAEGAGILSKVKNLFSSAKGAKNAATAAEGVAGAAEAAGTAAKGAGIFSKAKNIFGAIKGAKNISGVISAVKGAAAVGTAVEGATAVGAAGAGAGAAAAGVGAAGAGAAGAGLLATVAPILAPLAIAWLTDRAFKGIGGWFSAGENFGTDDPTLGMKASSALGTFLDSILPGDQSSWIQGIYNGGTKIGDKVKGFVGKAKDTISSIWSFGKDKLIGKSINDSTDPDTVQSNLLQGNSSILSSLLAVTSPITALTYTQLRNYKKYKEKESDLETKFLNKLTTSEREDYIANKNASLFGTMLRTQDSGKLVKTIMGTALLATASGAGGTGVVTQLVKAIGKATGTADAAENNNNTSTPGNDSPTDQNYSTMAPVNGDFFGRVSAKYEVGGGVDIAGKDLTKYVGYISSGAGDSGGRSYGLPQFPISNGTPQRFVAWLKKSGNPLYSKYFSSGFSDSNWKAAAKGDPNNFATAQIAFASKDDYLWFNRWSIKNYKLDWNRSRAMQEYGYEMAVAGPALASGCTKGAGVNASMSDKEILTKVNSYRISTLSRWYTGRSAGSISGWRKALPKILNDCLAFIGQPAIDLSKYGIDMKTNRLKGESITGGEPVSTASASNALTTSSAKADTNYESVNETINAINSSTLATTDPSVALMREALVLLTKITDNTKEVADKNIVEEYTETTKDSNNKIIKQTGKTSTVGINKFERRMNKILAGVS